MTTKEQVKSLIERVPKDERSQRWCWYYLKTYEQQAHAVLCCGATAAAKADRIEALHDLLALHILNLVDVLVDLGPAPGELPAGG